MAPYKTLERCFLCMGLCGIVVVSLGTLVASSEDLYRVLGVSRSASEADIKNAYRKQAKLWHPDKNKSPNARERFTEINQAYEVLSDSEKRHNYDITGRVGDSPQQSSGFPQGHGFTFTQGGFRFFFPSGSTHRSDGINMAQFYDEVLVQSHHKPYLLNFYTDFCMHCADVEVIWKAMHKDLASWGVGLASVHAQMYPRVVQHCGVSHVPSIVGVVSGRVHRYYGQLRDKSTMTNFLESILPKQSVAKVTDSNVDSFLFAAVQRNRPRLVLLSPRDSPSLLYKLTAFSNQKTADFGFVSTRSGSGGRVLQRFGVGLGERVLYVYKELFSPTSVNKGTLNHAVLQSVLEGLTLFLPRLSSQTLFNTVCPLSGNSFCVVLLVPGPAAYNDSLTSAFRSLSVENKSSLDSFAYVDSVKQAVFLSVLKPVTGVKCPSGDSARPVLIIRRAYNRFDWFDRFCGGDSDVSALLSHLSTLRTKVTAMRPLPRLPSLIDEEIPGWFGRMWNKVTGFFLDFNDFFLALGSGEYTPVMSLLFAVLVFCMVGLCIGTAEDPNNHPNVRQHVNVNREGKSTHSTRNNGHHFHHHGVHRSQPVIHELNQHSYEALVHGKHTHPQIALVILINVHHKTETTQVIQAFWRVTSLFKDRLRVNLFYQCYRTNAEWLGNVLAQCSEMESDEIKASVSGCLSGKVATVVSLLVSKKQICIFPESITNGTTNHFSEKLGSDDANGRPHREPVNQSLGDVLGSVFEFDDKDDHSTTKASHKHHSNGVSSAANHYNSENGLCSKAEQILTRFETWMEKFADGTLKRHKLTSWPEWTSAD